MPQFYESTLNVNRKLTPTCFCRVVGGETLKGERILAKREKVFTEITVGSLTITRTNFLLGASRQFAELKYCDVYGFF
jgi:hypothetical protein